MFKILKLFRERFHRFHIFYELSMEWHFLFYDSFLSSAGLWPLSIPDQGGFLKIRNAESLDKWLV